MHVSRAKRIVAAALAFGAGTALVAVMLTAGLVVLATGSGADPSTAFSEIPIIPERLEELVTWLPDQALAREVEPNTRALVESAWVQGWQQLDDAQRTGDRSLIDTWFLPNLAQHVGQSATATDAAAIRQYEHVFEVNFYSLDGSILAAEIESDIERILEGGPSVRAKERYDVVFLLSDGNWRMQHMHLVSASER